MHISEFDFALPPELIAQHPLAERDHSRMLIVNRQCETWQDYSFAELPTLLSSKDVLVINNTQVFPARLLGYRIMKEQRGAKIEALLVRQIAAYEWEVIARPGRALPLGALLEFGGGKLRGEVIEICPNGRRIIRFQADGNFDELVDEFGNTPLPPYIKRGYLEKLRFAEPRYQTIYAKTRGAIAAPTAGLHFTDRIFAALRIAGVEIIEITHHVGAATFQPVRVENIEAHRIEAERYEITEPAAQALNTARADGKRIIAVGTTTTRALESAVRGNNLFQSGSFQTELYIHPGYRFRAINGLLTNFHLPQSSLLFLVAAFAGKELLLRAYQHAINQQYRFYSYGDCMFIS